MKKENINSELTHKKTEKDNDSSLTPKNNMRKENITDLTVRYANDQVLASEIKGFKRGLSIVHEDFKVGDIIEFFGGYNGDIRYRAEILGFDKDGDIYLYWDSYWFPIRNDNARKINKI